MLWGTKPPLLEAVSILTCHDAYIPVDYVPVHLGSELQVGYFPRLVTARKGLKFMSVFLFVYKR